MLAPLLEGWRPSYGNPGSARAVCGCFHLDIEPNLVGYKTVSFPFTYCLPPPPPRKRSCGKVMFSLMFVSVHGGMANLVGKG